MNRPANIIEKNQHLARLHGLRDSGRGSVVTLGLSDDVIGRFLGLDPALALAIDRAEEEFSALTRDYPELLELDEIEQARRVQDGYVNFYAADAVNPYVALAAQGPWIVTLKGSVVYDCGGYGMLGLGHAPQPVLDAMNKPHVMANIMTPAVSQMRFIDALRKELGHTRGGSPFTRFLCLNSGSEAVSVAARIADIATKQMTDPDGRYPGYPVRGLTLKGSFHGRTDRPARHSHSTQKKYRKYLASFQSTEYLLTVEPNDIAGLGKGWRFHRGVFHGAGHG
jgi:4-aminobutyrate aminotransferase-like enzyme